MCVDGGGGGGGGWGCSCWLRSEGEEKRATPMKGFLNV